MRFGLNDWRCYAVDRGPCALLRVVTEESFCSWLDLPQVFEFNTQSFRQLLLCNRPKGLVIGTSTSTEGFKIESMLRLAATELKIPVVCIEDFSGNYQFVEHAITALLVVESEFSKGIYLGKLNNPPPISIMQSVRYDQLRHLSPNYSLVANAPVLRLLWAGQPETDYCLASLNFFLGQLKRTNLKVELYLRSHPDDKGVANGAYDCLASYGIPIFEANALILNASFYSGLHLVVTQFSSVAIEAGFYKVPALHILKKEAGRKLLLERTGSDEFVLEKYDAAFVISDDTDLSDMVLALTSDEERLCKLRNFDQFYQVNQKQMPLLISAIEGIL